MISQGVIDGTYMGECITKAMKARGVKQVELARCIGHKPQAVNHILKGRARPSLDTLFLICEVLNISADWVMGLAGQPEWMDRM